VFLTCLHIRTCLSVESSTIKFKLAAFNIQIFGQTKASHSAVMDIIVDTALRYDMLYIEELKDTPDNSCGTNTGPAICALQSQLNAASTKPYNLVVSKRVGDGSPEQYALLYKPSVVEVLQQYEYPDVLNQFTRTPSITQIKVKSTSYSFWVTQIHTSPSLAPQEIYALANVSKSIASDYQILLGDFNSDGSYFNEAQDWPYFFQLLPNYYNSINDSIDTTVNTNPYTYDRIVLSPKMKSRYVVGSPQSFYFDDISAGGFSMDAIKVQGCQQGYVTTGCPNSVTDLTAALEVSDHFPVEIVLSFPASSSSAAPQNIYWLISFIVITISMTIIMVN